MTEKQFKDEVTYEVTMSIFRNLYKNGIITAEEYAIIDTNMCKRYGVDLDSLYRDNDLIITDIYGNISPNKGVI